MMSGLTITRANSGAEVSNLEEAKFLASQNQPQLELKSSSVPAAIPWDLSDLTIYSFFCCPECNYRSQRDFLFRDHMAARHSSTITTKIECKPEPNFVLDSAAIESAIQEPFEELDDDDKDHYEILKAIANFKPKTTETKALTRRKGGSLKCQDCSITFMTSFRLQRHIKKFHGGFTPNMDVKFDNNSKISEMPRPYSCSFCQKSFTSSAYLASHIRKAHEKRFKCEECGKSYGGSSYLREHIEAVHKKARNYFCETCAASFYSKTQLTNHCLRNHSDGVEVACHECGKMFTNELSLKLHIRNVHQPVKSMCSQCGKKYPNEVSLKKHIQSVHEKLRPYQCHFCSKMFGSKWYVQQHVAKMHENRTSNSMTSTSFNCSDCEMIFTSIKERNIHLTKAHGKKAKKAKNEIQQEQENQNLPEEEGHPQQLSQQMGIQQQQIELHQLDVPDLQFQH